MNPIGQAGSSLAIDVLVGTDDLGWMTMPIYVSPDQEAIIDEVMALDARFGASEKLFHSQTAIASARALIDKAVNAGLDSRVFSPLQTWISLHETEQNMPEHLRSWQPLP